MKRKLFLPKDEVYPIGINGFIVYCDKSTEDVNHEVCDKCSLHGFHTLTGITMICKTTKDWEDDGWKEYIEKLGDKNE